MAGKCVSYGFTDGVWFKANEVKTCAHAEATPRLSYVSSAFKFGFNYSQGRSEKAAEAVAAAAATAVTTSPGSVLSGVVRHVRQVRQVLVVPLSVVLCVSPRKYIAAGYFRNILPIISQTGVRFVKASNVSK